MKIYCKKCEEYLGKSNFKPKDINKGGEQGICKPCWKIVIAIRNGSTMEKYEDKRDLTPVHDRITPLDSPLRHENQMKPLKPVKTPYIMGITKSEKEARKDDAQIARRKNKSTPIYDVNIRKVMSDLMSGKTQDMHPEHKSMMDVWIA